MKKNILVHHCKYLFVRKIKRKKGNKNKFVVGFHPTNNKLYTKKVTPLLKK